MSVTISIGLTGHDLLTHGVEQHMSDAPYRGTAIFSDSWNASNFQPYMVDGHVAKVAYVNSQSELANAADNSAVDVIAINGKVTTTGTINLNNTQIITGGDFDFTENGHNYSMALGKDGEISNGTTGQAIFNVNDNSSADETIEHLTLDANAGDTTMAAITNSGSFKNLTLIGNTINGGVDIDEEAGKSGTVNLEDNTFNTTDEAAVSLTANGASASLTVNEFSGNVLNTSVDSSASSTVSALVNTASDGGTLDYAAAFDSNTISVANNSSESIIGIDNEATGSGSTLSFDGGMTNNTETVTNNDKASSVIGIKNNATDSADLTMAAINNNKITMDDTASSTTVTGIDNVIDGTGNETITAIEGNTLAVTGDGSTLNGIKTEANTNTSTSGRMTVDDIDDNDISVTGSSSTNSHGISVNDTTSNNSTGSPATNISQSVILRIIPSVLQVAQGHMRCLLRQATAEQGVTNSIM